MHRGRWRNLAALAACAAALSAGCAGVEQGNTPAAVDSGQRRVLRVCADPNNLPYSNDAHEGFENRLAEIVAEELGATLEYVWWAQRRGFVRNTLRAGACDVLMGVPTSFELAATTRPYYRSSYVFVVPEGAAMPASFDDPLLRQVRVGVHLVGDDAANTPPAHALSARGIIANVRGYSLYGDYRLPNPPANLINAVADGEVDVAIAWGPLAGYFVKRARTPLATAAVSPEIDPPFLPFVFDIAMGVRREDEALRDELDAIIVRRRDAFDAVLAEYHVPRIDRRVAAR